MLFLFYFVINCTRIFAIFRANCCMHLLLKLWNCLYYSISQCMGHIMWKKYPRGNSINELILIRHPFFTSKYKIYKISSFWSRRLAKKSWGLFDQEPKVLTNIHHIIHCPMTKVTDLPKFSHLNWLLSPFPGSSQDGSPRASFSRLTSPPKISIS